MSVHAKKFYYVYEITNCLNDKSYIGVHSTNNLDDGYMGSGRYLRNAQNKYGIDNFKKRVIEFFPSREQAYEKERELITYEYLKSGKTYNLNVGGEGGFFWINDNPVIRKRSLKARQERIKNATPEMKLKWKENADKNFGGEKRKEITLAAMQVKSAWSEEKRNSVKKSISNGLTKFWSKECETSSYRKHRGNKTRTYMLGLSTEEKQVKFGKKGFLNNEFSGRIEEFEGIKAVAINLITETQYSDSEIYELLNIKTGTDVLARYYEYKNYLVIDNKIKFETIAIQKTKKVKTIAHFNSGISKNINELLPTFSRIPKYDSLSEKIASSCRTDKFDWQIKKELLLDNLHIYLNYYQKLGLLRYVTEMKNARSVERQKGRKYLPKTTIILTGESIDVLTQKLKDKYKIIFGEESFKVFWSLLNRKEKV